MAVGDLCMYGHGVGLAYPFEVAGEEGRLAGDVVLGRLALYPRDGDGEPIDISPRRDAAAEVRGFPGTVEILREFADCIEGRRAAPRAGAEAGVVAAEIASAIEESVASGGLTRLGQEFDTQVSALDGRRRI